MSKRSENMPDDDEKNTDPIPGYLLTGIYTAFTVWVFSSYITDRKLLLLLSPMVYLFWYAMLFFTEDSD